MLIKTLSILLCFFIFTCGFYMLKRGNKTTLSKILGLVFMLFGIMYGIIMISYYILD